MEIKIPSQVETMIGKLKDCGQEAYIVGGCVRDSIMGLTPHDWDVTTSAQPQEVMAALNGFKLIGTGLKHGTVTVLLDKMPIEVTTYRVDGEYSDNRHPDEVRFTRSLKEDLARRDFTVNALAYNHEDGIIDCFGGLEDIQSKQIRCVGEPELRFHEDGLRILRALRFSSVLGFAIEDTTSKSIHSSYPLLDFIAKERINTEFTKLLCGKNADSILREYREVVGQFLPEIKATFGFEQHNDYHVYDVWEHTLKAVASVDAIPVLRLTMLLHDIGKPLCFTQDEKGVGHFYGHDKKSVEMSAEILRRLKYDSDTVNQVVTLVQYHDVSLSADQRTLRQLLCVLGEETLWLLLKVKAADMIAQNPAYRDRVKDLKQVEAALDDIISQNLCYSLKNLEINGSDLISLGVPQGMEVGRILSLLLNEVIDDKYPNKHWVLMNRARLIKDNQL